MSHLNKYLSKHMIFIIFNYVKPIAVICEWSLRGEIPNPLMLERSMQVTNKLNEVFAYGG